MKKHRNAKIDVVKIRVRTDLDGWRHGTSELGWNIISFEPTLDWCVLKLQRETEHREQEMDR